MTAPPGAAALNRDLDALLNAPDGEALFQVLTRCPGLLHPGLERFLTRRIAQAWRLDDLAACAGYLSARALLASLATARATGTPPPFVLPLGPNSPLIRLAALDEAPATHPLRIELLREALALLRPDDEGDLRATFERDLADSLLKAPGPGRAARLREALAHYERALQLWGESPGRGSEVWARTQFAMGRAYRALRDGDLDAQRERAIACYSEALTVLARDADPLGWSRATRELAIALMQRQGEARSAGRAEALRLLETVVGSPPPPGAEELWPAEQGRAWIAMGNAYTHQLEGGRALRLGQARDAYRRAAELLPRERFPLDWAHIQYDAAIALIESPAGRRDRNLRAARLALRRALGILTPEAHSEDWVMAQTVLGNLLCQRDLPGPRDQHLAEAIARYRQALERCREEDDRERWATLQNNLANALAERGVASPDDQEEAIRLYEQALRARPREASPARWAETVNNLGAIYSERLRGSPADNQRRARDYLRQALELRETGLFPVEARRAARNLGRVELAAGRWADAAEAFARAIAAGDGLYRLSISSAGREAELAEGRGLYAERAYALVRDVRGARSAPVIGDDPRLVDAAVCLEAGRARALAEGLALRRRMAEAADPATRERWRDAHKRIPGLEAELRRPGGRPHAEVVRELEAAWAALPPLEVEDLPSFTMIAGQAGPAHALAYLAEVGAELYALIVGGRAAGARCLGPLPAPPLAWRPPQGPGQAAGPDDPLAALGAALMRPLAGLLLAEGVGAITLVPCGRLSLLPLHAAPYAGEGGERCLLDELTVAYAPGARALARARALASARPAGRRLAGVGNPRPTPSELRSAEPELRAVAELLGPGAHCVLTGEGAGRAELDPALPGAAVVHLACHGSFNAGAPLQSGLALARGDRLSLDDLLAPGFTGLGAARLVTLSACQSAVTEGERLPDEAIGLPAGFLQAGAPAVVGTLWSVADASTALAMVRFYELLVAGAPLAEALCRTQRWLRTRTAAEIRAYLDQQRRAGVINNVLAAHVRAACSRPGQPDPPFADRYFWAPFTIQGATETIL